MTPSPHTLSSPRLRSLSGFLGLVLGTLILGASPVFALETAYVSFKHPDNWGCELSQGVWICQSNRKADRKESVILSIAALATEWDSLDNYVSYLKKPRRIQDDKGTPITSKVVYVRKRKINDTFWVDSLQRNSELPGFWTRYLSTVQNTKGGRLAILITYIVSNERYQKLSPGFEKMVASLKPKVNFDATVASKQGGQLLPGATVLGQMQKNIAERLRSPSEAPAPDEPEKNPLDLLLVGLVVVFAGIYLFVRRRQKKN